MSIYDWGLFERLVEGVPVKVRDKEKDAFDVEMRDFIRTRDGLKCRVCGYKKIPERLYVHHIVPNGSASEDNLILLCTTCHEFVHLQLRSKGYAYFRLWR